MERSTLQKLVKQKESASLEFKPGLSETDRIVEVACSFANAKGGVVLVGVSDSGNVVGVDVGKQTVERLVNTIVDNTDPNIYPEISVERIDGKEIIFIDVKQSSTRPNTAFGRPFIRVGKNTKMMKQSEYEQLLLKRKPRIFDSQVCEGASLKDINQGKVKWFLVKAKGERNLDIRPDMAVKDALERLGLLKNSKVTNAGILLFGKAPQRFFAQAETRCGRFKGTEPLEFIDMKAFGGNVIDQRDNAIAFVKEHIKLNARIVGTERVETWEYPIEAIREAITNAVCHRDYEVASNIQVRIFDDRVEVWGCGPLPQPLTPDDLRGKHRSILRNPLIAKCLFLVGYVEEWGTGTNRIIEWCMKNGLPEPVFEEVSGSLVVTIRKYHVTEEMLARLNERQKRALGYVKEKGRITNRDFQELYHSVSRKTITRDLRDLVQKNLLREKGEKKGVYYELS